MVLALQLRRSSAADRRGRLSPVRVFHLVPIRPVRGALGEQRQQSRVIHAVRTRSADCGRGATSSIPTTFPEQLTRLKADEV